MPHLQLSDRDRTRLNASNEAGALRGISRREGARRVRRAQEALARVQAQSAAEMKAQAVEGCEQALARAEKQAERQAEHLVAAQAAYDEVVMDVLERHGGPRSLTGVTLETHPDTGEVVGISVS